MECLTNIYTLSCPFTGQVRYVGKTNTTLNNRCSSHISEAKKGTQGYKNIWLRSLLKNDARPIIELVDQVKDWEFWESFYISLYRSWGFKLTNNTSGGEGSPGYKQSPETLAKRIRSGKDHWGYGKKRSDEFKKKSSEAHKGFKHPKEFGLAISARLKLYNPKTGRKLTQEQRNRIKESWKTRPFSFDPEGTHKRQSDAAKIGWAKRRAAI